MRYEPQGLDRWANTDPSMHVNGGSPRQSERWQGAWMWCLRFNDEESAHLIRLRNDERYAERCEQEALNVFPITGVPLKSLREVQSEVESEALEVA